MTFEDMDRISLTWKKENLPGYPAVVLNKKEAADLRRDMLVRGLGWRVQPVDWSGRLVAGEMIPAGTLLIGVRIFFTESEQDDPE
jgi:hypothetical protein